MAVVICSDFSWARFNYTSITHQFNPKRSRSKKLNLYKQRVQMVKSEQNMAFMNFFHSVLSYSFLSLVVDTKVS